MFAMFCMLLMRMPSRRGCRGGAHCAKAQGALKGAEKALEMKKKDRWAQDCTKSQHAMNIFNCKLRNVVDVAP